MSTLESHTCGECGIEYAAPAVFWRERRANHDMPFFCPNGHRRYFVGQTEEQKLRAERDRLKQQMAFKEDQVRWAEQARIDADRRASAMKGQVTRLKNRAAAGVCPCCNRSFENLKRHMATKHAGFVAEPIEPGENVVPLRA